MEKEFINEPEGIMKFSPPNIKKQEFTKSMRGYDKEEVQAFLDKLANEVDELQKDNEKLKAELDETQTKLVEYKKKEKNLQQMQRRVEVAVPVMVHRAVRRREIAPHADPRLLRPLVLVALKTCIDLGRLDELVLVHLVHLVAVRARKPARLVRA